MSEKWNDTGEDVTMPLGVGEQGSAGEIELVSGEKKSAVSPTVMLLVGVFAAGLALIYLLGMQNRPRSAGAAVENGQVSSAVQELLSRNGNKESLKAIFRDTDKLVEVFYHASGATTVDFDEVPGNPFEHEGQAKPAGPVAVMPAAPTNTAEMQRLKKLGEAFDQLRLQSIMMSKSMTTAMINNKLVHVGSVLGEFTVSEIEADRVILSHGVSRFELRLKRDKDSEGR